ncbi:MAG: hypothetical protein GX868_14260 [Actinobacteria bacterium]|nr:hypothetical protein [Actinomycetota bacterium]
MDTPDRTAAENTGDADYCWELLATAERLLRDGTSDETDGIALIEHALTECGTDPAIALNAHLALAQILSPQALDVETEKLEVVVGHARRAVEAAIELGTPSRRARPLTPHSEQRGSAWQTDSHWRTTSSRWPKRQTT